ncbi:MAG: Holliday junction branch migration protein RuvA [Clostridia bacterium]|nr:Holliday junction branch migration protein RuvA [Clostridia bacterium]
MIGYLKGNIISIENSECIIDVNNIGFKVMMPSYELAELNEGETVAIFTHLNVREDALDLYGSKDKKVMELFKRLIDVSGIGPKTAMGILSKFDASDLVCAIINADSNLISTCPGIGKKTAERLVLELRDKLMKQGIEAGDNTKVREAKKAKEENNEVKQEAFDALVNLGYKKQDAKAVIDKSYEDGMSLEQLIKKCLTR